MGQQVRRLTLEETLRVHDWLKENAPRLANRSTPSVATEASAALSIDISVSSIRTIAGEIGLQLGKPAGPTALAEKLAAAAKRIARLEEMVDVLWDEAGKDVGKVNAA